MAIDEAVRVCYGCYIKLKLSRVAKKDGPLPPYPGAPQQQQSPAAQAAPSLVRAPTASNHPQPITTTTADNNNTNVEDTQFEEDLKKALELSKIDAEQANGYGGYSTSSHYNNVESNKTAEQEQTSSLVNNNNQQQQSEGQEGEEDPELAAAIAASLKDMEDAQKSTFEYYSNQKVPTTRAATTTTTITTGGKGDELTPVEMENIELFSLLIHRINDSGNTIGNDDQINRLYTQIGTLQPKLVKNLDEASRKYRK